MKKCLMEFQDCATLDVVYTNWKGEVEPRRIKVLDIFWGSNQYHTEPQWLVTGYDCHKAAIRTFAMKDMVPV